MEYVISNLPKPYSLKSERDWMICSQDVGFDKEDAANPIENRSSALGARSGRGVRYLRFKTETGRRYGEKDDADVMMNRAWGHDRNDVSILIRVCWALQSPVAHRRAMSPYFSRRCCEWTPGIGSLRGYMRWWMRFFVDILGFLSSPWSCGVRSTSECKMQRTDHTCVSFHCSSLMQRFSVGRPSHAWAHICVNTLPPISGWDKGRVIGKDWIATREKVSCSSSSSAYSVWVCTFISSFISSFICRRVVAIGTERVISYLNCHNLIVSM